MAQSNEEGRVIRPMREQSHRHDRLLCPKPLNTRHQYLENHLGTYNQNGTKAAAAPASNPTTVGLPHPNPAPAQFNASRNIKALPPINNVPK
jgi:hypothetical protein